MHTNAFDGHDMGKIASLLFEYASAGMVKEEILSYAICVYGHDTSIMTSMAYNGFDMGCSDAIRKINTPINIQINKAYTYGKIRYYDYTFSFVRRIDERILK